MRLEGHIDLCEPGHVAGWARDLDAPGAALRLQVYAGRAPLGGCVADGRRDDLDAAGVGAHGFGFVPPWPLTPEERDTLHVRAEGSDLALFDAFGGAQPNPFLMPPPPRPALARFARCVLHIGTEKTGTTSLQRFFALNRQALMGQGVFVPVSLAPADPEGGLNHSDLAALALADWRLDDPLRLARGIGDAAGLARFRAQAAAALASEIALVPERCTTLLLSSEHCHSRMQLLHEIAALHGFLAPWVERFEVVVYLRPQHELAMSQHAMHLLAGAAVGEVLPDGDGMEPAYFDYARLLARWSAIFGREAMRPAIYGAGALREDDIVADFFGRLGVGIEAMVRPPRLAGNISAPAQALLHAVRAASAGLEEAGWIAGFLATNLRRSAPGRGILPTRGRAEAFVAQFAAGNARVREEWFAGRPALFALDFSGLPEAETATALAVTEVVGLLVGLLQAEAQRQG
jgi:hypothetical protein